MGHTKIFFLKFKCYCKLEHRAEKGCLSIADWTTAYNKGRLYVIKYQSFHESFLQQFFYIIKAYKNRFFKLLNELYSRILKIILYKSVAYIENESAITRNTEWSSSASTLKRDFSHIYILTRSIHQQFAGLSSHKLFAISRERFRYLYVNFINVFGTKVLSYFCQSQNVTREKLPKRHSYKKFAQKMLMKSTPRRYLAPGVPSIIKIPTYSCAANIYITYLG